VEPGRTREQTRGFTGAFLHLPTTEPRPILKGFITSLDDHPTVKQVADFFIYYRRQLGRDKLASHIVQSADKVGWSQLLHPTARDEQGRPRFMVGEDYDDDDVVLAALKLHIQPMQKPERVLQSLKFVPLTIRGDEDAQQALGRWVTGRCNDTHEALTTYSEESLARIDLVTAAFVDTDENGPRGNKMRSVIADTRAAGAAHLPPCAVYGRPGLTSLSRWIADMIKTPQNISGIDKATVLNALVPLVREKGDGKGDGHGGKRNERREAEQQEHRSEPAASDNTSSQPRASRRREPAPSPREPARDSPPRVHPDPGDGAFLQTGGRKCRDRGGADEHR